MGERNNAKRILLRKPEGKTQNYWAFGLRPSSDVLGARRHNDSETGFVSVLR
jgi:hypothetical protein